MDLKDPDLKKLGIQNSKDRARMLGSLATYKKKREGNAPSEHLYIKSHTHIVSSLSLTKRESEGELYRGEGREGERERGGERGGRKLTHYIQVGG